jgi:hypothetical protein
VISRSKLRDAGRSRAAGWATVLVPFGGGASAPVAWADVLHVRGNTHLLAHEPPQNVGSEIGEPDPGVRYGLFVEGDRNSVTRFSVEVPGTGSYTLFGDADTAIGLSSGVFGFMPSARGTVTLNNPIRVLQPGSYSSLYSDTAVPHRVVYGGPLLLKGNLVMGQGHYSNYGVGVNPNVAGIVAEYAGPITVASDDAVFHFSSQSEGIGHGLISGDIRNDGAPRTLTLGSFRHVLMISGDNTGLTGGIRAGLWETEPSLVASRFRFLNLPSMGGGGDGNLRIGLNAIAGIGFRMTDQVFAKIDPRSTGTLAIDGDSSLNLDLANFDGLLGCTVGDVRSPVSFTGRIDPKGATYRFGGGGGALRIQAPHSLSGARGLTLGRPQDAPMALILDNPQSFTGPVHIVRGQLIINYPRALHPDSPIRIDGGTLRFGVEPVGGEPHTHDAPISIGERGAATLWASRTSAPDYDLVLNGGISGGTNLGIVSFSSGLIFTGGGRFAINGDANTYLTQSAIEFATVYVNGSIAAGGDEFVVNGGTLAGVGTIARPVRLRVFNVVTPGNPQQPVATLTVDDNFAVERRLGLPRVMTFDFQFGDAGSDLLNITGNVSSEDATSGSLKLLPLSGAELLAGSTIPFMDIGGSIDRDFPWTVDTSAAPAFAGSYVTFDQINTRYVVTLVPEPAGEATVCSSLAVALLNRRRRRSVDTAKS